MANRDDFEPPTPSGGDTAHLLVKAALSAVPVAGGPAAELFAALLTPPLEKRRQSWMQEVASSLRRLESDRVISPDKLKNNEEFTSLLVQATVVAISNHHSDKRAALRNCVLNAVIASNIDVDIQLSFIRFIDELSPADVKLLRLLSVSTFEIAVLQSYEELYSFVAPRLQGTIGKAIFKMFFMDLESRGLIWISQDIGDFPGIYEASSLLLQGTRMDLPRIVVSDVGRSFLEFIGTVPSNVA